MAVSLAAAKRSEVNCNFSYLGKGLENERKYRENRRFIAA